MNSIAKSFNTEYLDYQNVIQKIINFSTSDTWNIDILNQLINNKIKSEQDIIGLKCLIAPEIFVKWKNHFKNLYKQNKIKDDDIKSIEDPEQVSNAMLYLHSKKSLESISTFANAIDKKNQTSLSTTIDTIISEYIKQILATSSNNSNVIKMHLNATITNKLKIFSRTSKIDDTFCRYYESLPQKPLDSIITCLKELSLNTEELSYYMLTIHHNIYTKHSALLSNCNAQMTSLITELMAAYINFDCCLINTLSIESDYKEWIHKIKSSSELIDKNNSQVKRHLLWNSLAENIISNNIINGLSNISKDKTDYYVIYHQNTLSSNELKNISSIKNTKTIEDLMLGETSALSSLKNNLDAFNLQIDSVIENKNIISDNSNLELAHYYIKLLQIEASWPKEIIFISQDPNLDCKNSDLYHRLSNILNSDTIRELLDRIYHIKIPKDTVFSHIAKKDKLYYLVSQETTYTRKLLTNIAQQPSHAKFNNQTDYKADSSHIFDAKEADYMLSSVINDSAALQTVSKPHYYLLTSANILGENSKLTDIRILNYNYLSQHSVYSLEVYLIYLAHKVLSTKTFLYSVGAPMVIYIHSPQKSVAQYIQKNIILNQLLKYNVIKLYGIEPSTLEIYNIKSIK